MNKTYSEQRQAILFKAARDLRKVACQVLDDCTEPAEFRGTTYRWARELAASIMRRAAELENEGHQAIATPAVEGHLYKSKDANSRSVDRHLRLFAEYNERACGHQFVLTATCVECRRYVNDVRRAAPEYNANPKGEL